MSMSKAMSVGLSVSGIQLHTVRIGIPVFVQLNIMLGSPFYRFNMIRNIQYTARGIFPCTGNNGIKYSHTVGSPIFMIIRNYRA